MADRKPQRELMTFAPDGTRHVFRTAAGYHYAGFIRVTSPRGMTTWQLVAKGWSLTSVHSRTVTAGNKTDGADRVYTSGIREAYPAVLTAYFGAGARLQLSGQFRSSWERIREPADVTTRGLRELAAAGVTDVTICALGPASREVDFSVAELLAKGAV